MTETLQKANGTWRDRVMHRDILRIAVPSIVSNVTVPLLGLVDVTITGHMGAAAYIGAIAVGGMIFNMMYWLCGFLRMSTGGFASQAFGAGLADESRRVLLRALQVALGLGLLFIVFQFPIRSLALFIMSPSPMVESYVLQYFAVLVWGAPAVLATFVFNGWFLGMQNARVPMIVAITQNVVNILLSLLFVVGLGMKVEGVALGTLIAQYVGVLLSVAFCVRLYGAPWQHKDLRGLWKDNALARFFSANSDIFLRTLFMVAVQVWFTSRGAHQGDTILAVNALLMQLFLLFSYFMDGFAYAGEALAGRFAGGRDFTSLRRLTLCLFVWGVALTALFMLVYWLGGAPFLSLLTDNATVVEAAEPYLLFAVLIPACGCAAFLFDGLFVGLIATRQMLVAVLLAAIVYFALCAALMPVMGNAGLWLSLLAFLSVRGLVQAVLYPRILRRLAE